MNSPPSQPADISLLDDVGGCFEAVAAAIALVLDNGTVRPGRLEQSLPLLAEAQSALRAAIQGIHAPNDPDQLQVFEWLKRTAAQQHVYIKRHMRADDLADPTRWRDLLDRIARVDARYQQTRRRSQKEGAWIDRVRRHLELIGEGKGAERDWQELIKTIDEMVSEGIAPSNSEIRELLLPVIDELPDRDELPHGFRLVLREIDRFLATRTPSSGAAVSSRTNRRGQGARRLLEGRSAVLIGGMLPPGVAEVAENGVGSEGADLDRDQGTPVDRGVRVPHRPRRRRLGPPGHPLVEPCVRGRETVLRSLRQASGPASRGLQPEPGRRPDPFAVQRATWGWVMIRPLRPHPARLPSSRPFLERFVRQEQRLQRPDVSLHQHQQVARPRPQSQGTSPPFDRPGEDVVEGEGRRTPSPAAGRPRSDPWRRTFPCRRAGQPLVINSSASANWSQPCCWDFVGFVAMSNPIATG